jgi:hypothetical protein
MRRSSILFNLLGAVGLFGLLSGCGSGGGGGAGTTTNAAPVINSAPALTGTQGTAYSYAVNATDANGDTLTYSLVPSPVAPSLVEPVPFGMTIDPASGVISWTPAAQEGANQVTVQVSDGRLLSTQPFTVMVTVAATQVAPVFITPIALPQALEQVPYTATVIAADANNDAITYSLTTAPAGMTIDRASGLISWAPTNANVGPNAVTVQAQDSGVPILSATQTFTINVSTAPAANGVTFGFDNLSRDGFNATLTGSWDTISRLPDVFSTVSNSSVIVRGTATVTIDNKGRPRFSFPEFTFQGVDLFNNNGTSPASFAIIGYQTGNDRLPTFSLTVTVPVSDSLQLPNSGLDDSGNPMNVKIDELWITGINSSSSEFGVGCLGVGATGGSPTCP